jgi:hypothetical protein
MKTKSFFLAVISMLGFSFATMAQSVSCSDFTVTGFSMDSLDSTKYNFSIEFSAPDTTFVNYPYISAVLDCNGDTVATGSFNFFGQVGQSTFEYPVTVSGSLACQPLSIVFIYANDFLENDTCSLALNSVGLINSLEKEEVLSIFPNPVINNLTIQNNQNQFVTNYIILEHSGRKILEGTIDAETSTIDLHNLPAGVYFMSLGENLILTVKFMKQ